MPDYLQALRDCCRDEAAFERLKKILALAVKDKIFCQEIGSLEADRTPSNPALSEIKCQTSKQSYSDAGSSKAISRIFGYQEESVDVSAIEINAGMNTSEKLKIQELFVKEGKLHNLKYGFNQNAGELRVGRISEEIDNFTSPAGEIAVSTDIPEIKPEDKPNFNSEKICASPQAIQKGYFSQRLLGEMALRIRKSLNLEQILNTTVEEVREFLQADRVFIGGLDDGGNGEILAESVAANWRSLKGWKLKESYVQEIKSFYERSHSRAIEDTTELERTPFLSEYYDRYQVKAGLGVAIIVDDKFFGVLVANQCSKPRKWEPVEIDLLSKLATQVAIAIQQAQLYKQVQTLNANLERQVEERTTQLQERNHQLQESNRIKDVLLHTVAHDIRTSVMGTLMVFKNWLQQPGETISIPRKILEKMVTGSDRQLNMINSLLETNACTEQGAIVHRESIQFSILLKSIIKDLQPMLLENQAKLTNLVPMDLPSVMADPTQIQRLFASLFTKILKQNPPGLNLTLHATVEGKMLRCTLDDNGMGMSQVECDRLFDLYVRDPQARCSTGIGLKLYVCRQIITAHGGQIGITSSPGSGAKIWFTLPLANEP